MAALDIQTLLLVSIFVLFLTAILVWLAALQARRDPCLVWVALALALGGLGIACSALRIWSLWVFQIIWLGNVLLITAHACVWTALRRFANRQVRWGWLSAGALVWSLLCLWPAFMEEPAWRILAYSLLCAAYFTAAVIEISPFRRHDPQAVFPLMAVLIIHIALYLFRVIVWSGQFQFWAQRPDTALTIFALLLMAIGISFTALILVRGREEQRFRYDSLHDSLTRLPNRRALFSQGAAMIKAAAGQQREAALLMFDLDRFKRINDEQGHLAGDQLLRDFGSILQATMRPGDLCARIGGEEFVVLAINMAAAEAVLLFEHIQNELAQQNRNWGTAPSTSAGIAMASVSGYDIQALLACADTALYKAKSDGRCCARLWSDDMAWHASRQTRYLPST